MKERTNSEEEDREIGDLKASKCGRVDRDGQLLAREEVAHDRKHQQGPKSFHVDAHR